MSIYLAPIAFTASK